MSKPKYYPITFTTEMVQAILDERKTQTRRVIPASIYDHIMLEYDRETGAPFYMHSRKCPGYCDYACGGYFLQHYVPRYGAVGDRLWVKEAWYHDSSFHPPERRFVFYAADDENVWLDRPGTRLCTRMRWKSGRFMPRWASRITLEITGTRVQRLHEISIDDAVAEGTTVYCVDCNATGKEMIPCDPADTRCEFCGGVGRWPWEFRKLWDSLNAKRGYGWEGNWWVYVREFKRLMEN